MGRVGRKIPVYLLCDLRQESEHTRVSFEIVPYLFGNIRVDLPDQPKRMALR